VTRIVVIDRFEEGLAVLVPDDADELLHVPRVKLPPGAREGDCLRMEEGGELQLAPEETARRRGRVKSKLDRLRRR
jgi:hypothetical protein